jgi:hypothetical protein
MYYLTQEYIFRCIDKNTFDKDLYFNGFPANDDNLYQIIIKIGYDENHKIYFPFIRYQKAKKNFAYIYVDGELKSEYISDTNETIIEDYGDMFDNYIFKNYGDVYIKYDSFEDIYNFIQNLLMEFTKDTIVPKDSIFKIGISNDNYGESKYYSTHYTIYENFNLEYFTNKINNIIHIDKYIHLLHKFTKSCYGDKMKKPVHGLLLPWENNEKLKADYPVLSKWL